VGMLGGLSIWIGKGLGSGRWSRGNYLHSDASLMNRGSMKF